VGGGCLLLSLKQR